MPSNPDSPEYNPKRDGSLDDYLDIHNGISSCPLFRGLSIYRRLMREGYFLPELSGVRLMWNTGRGDEHFMVNTRYNLVGIDVEMHSGRPGVHKPEDILKKDGPCWEAQYLARSPELRKQALKIFRKFQRKRKKK